MLVPKFSYFVHGREESDILERFLREPCWLIGNSTPLLRKVVSVGSVAPLPAVEDPDLIPGLWYGLLPFCCTFAPSPVQTEEMGKQYFLKMSVANGRVGRKGLGVTFSLPEKANVGD